MAYFYCSELNQNDGEILLNRDESNHFAKTLRGKVGDSIHLLDGLGNRAIAIISEINRNSVRGKIKSIEEVSNPETRIHVYLAPPRHNIMTPLIKQCVELGVWSINLIECDFSVSKPKDKKGAFESEIIAGAKQSGNPFFPEIHAMTKFTSALKGCSHPKFYGAVPVESIDPESLTKKGDISLWIGPEGGFSPKEIQALKESGAQGITVGKWILRVETALIALLGVLNS